MSYDATDLYHGIRLLFEEAQHRVRPSVVTFSDGLTVIVKSIEATRPAVRRDIREALLLTAWRSNVAIAEDVGADEATIARARSSMGLPPSDAHWRGGPWRTAQRARERIAAALTAPGGEDRPNSSIARELGACMKTVARVRRELALRPSEGQRRTAGESTRKASPT